MRNVRLFLVKLYVLDPCTNLSNVINTGVVEEMHCSYIKILIRIRRTHTWLLRSLIPLDFPQKSHLVAFRAM